MKSNVNLYKFSQSHVNTSSLIDIIYKIFYLSMNCYRDVQLNNRKQKRRQEWMMINEKREDLILFILIHLNPFTNCLSYSNERHVLSLT